MLKNFLSLILLLAASACTTSGIDPAKLHQAVDRLDRAVYIGDKMPESALTAYEALYRKYPTDPIIAGPYADALQNLGRDRQAADVLRPFIAQNDVNRLSAPVFMAYMRLLIHQGYAKDAERYLRQRLVVVNGKEDKAASFAQISNLLGLALAKQGRKAEAAQAFHAALAQWDSYPGIVEANLGRLEEN